MGTVKHSEIASENIGEKRTRYLTHTKNLMVAVIDFHDGPTSEPDEPHSHPHEQVSYVAEGEIIFFLDGNPTHLVSGDMFTVPSNVLHSVQLLTEHVRLVDSFNPIREDFLSE
ncbi:MAG: cupin domain-containing protein [SAR324 cluster bacterium]|nr:cupin domain-containing protein [SAR324 cluster bacterium]